jgi:hypothetical protein
MKPWCKDGCLDAVDAEWIFTVVGHDTAPDDMFALATWDPVFTAIVLEVQSGDWKTWDNVASMGEAPGVHVLE